jgi:hypothetical protein
MYSPVHVNFKVIRGDDNAIRYNAVKRIAIFFRETDLQRTFSFLISALSSCSMASYFEHAASPHHEWSPSRRSPFVADIARGSQENYPTMRENVVEAYSDRFIPARSTSRLENGFAILSEMQSQSGRASPANASVAGQDGEAREGQPILNTLLRSELLGMEPASPNGERTEGISSTSQQQWSSGNIFRFRSQMDLAVEDPRSVYDLSPIKAGALLMSPRKAKRKIAKTPFKVLDAPALQDDFYLNLVDW